MAEPSFGISFPDKLVVRVVPSGERPTIDPMTPASADKAITRINSAAGRLDDALTSANTGLRVREMTRSTDPRRPDYSPNYQTALSSSDEARIRMDLEGKQEFNIEIGLDRGWGKVDVLASLPVDADSLARMPGILDAATKAVKFKVGEARSREVSIDDIELAARDAIKLNGRTIR